MGVSCLVTRWCAVALLLGPGLLPRAEAGWTPAGPERGHVLDAAVGATRVAVATRVGVLTAPLDGPGPWTRDARLPGDTRRLAFAPGRDDLAWAAVPGGVWLLEGEALRPLWSSPQDTVIELLATPDAAWALVRGPQGGLWRIPARGEPQRLLALDPACLDLDGEALLVGGQDGRVWSGPPGDLRERAALSSPVSACAWQGGRAWVATAAGEVFADDALVATLGGAVVALAPAGEGVVAAVEGLAGAEPALLRLGDGPPEAVPLALDDPGKVDWTGLWPLGGDRLLVGTFRRGPLVLEPGGLRPAREGFRATMLGGVDVDDGGRLLLALMGTGVYTLEPDGAWRGLHGSESAVTDTVAVEAVSGGMAVLDFNGLGFWGADGRWLRRALAPMAALGEGPDGHLWALDGQGSLWLLDGEAWRRCAGPPGLRLDGRGEALRLVAREALHRPGPCETPWPRDAALPPMPGHRTRADGGWVAAPGSLWRDGARLAELPRADVTALATRGDEALVGLKDGRVLACAPSCVPLTTLPGEVGALAWLPDGRRVLVERAGTLWLEGGDAQPPPWPRRYLGRLEVDLMSLERPARAGGAAFSSPAPSLAPSLAPSTAPSPRAKATHALVGLLSLALGWALTLGAARAR